MSSEAPAGCDEEGAGVLPGSCVQDAG